ncbi:S8 family serine peptidase [Pseudoalteromonas denitrificans]|uniref:PA domain-containing protein n=1 Tax=Pseudoalteromonas denitrificans DSM 6059 TaxID=1123010 RepID=A0A1I1STZ2_9GAMM|nr:S8 family serine peptidase [Pseudoalteromonas denitrificans]SFD46510.1 PA domain-containing protein [Pseudoalteromonas denitrificans DSM 6059]
MNKLTFTKSFIAMAVLGTISSSSFAERFVIQVDNVNKGIITALSQQLGGEVVLDADGFIAVEFDGQSLDGLKGILKNPHIKLIEIDQKRKLLSLFNDDAGNPAVTQLTPYAVYQSQANQVTFNHSAGIKVCIIDSGLDQSNTDFNRTNSNITGTNDSGTGNWFEHGGPHGTHVAGTIGAADNTFGVIGMAPGVAMHIIKVFEETGWAYSSTLANAADICASKGAHIISMSLGGGSPSNAEENAFNNFVSGGGLVVAAAGNDANAARSYPAGYSSVVMVGANDADNNIADFSQYPSCLITVGRGRNRQTVHDETVCVELTAGGVDTLSTYPAQLGNTTNLIAGGSSYDSAAMENMGSASGSTYFMGTAEATDSGASGKICMIDRGAVSFHDKVLNCENSGGLGAVIINNEPGMLYGTLGTANATSIPTVGAALADRTLLLAATSVSIDVLVSDYGYMSGTSMATPAVSGVAALVWSNFPSCTGEDVRAALKETALDGGEPGNDDKFGYGIVQAKDAHAYLMANGCADVVDPDVEFTLSANGVTKGKQRVNLSWLGTSSNVDIYRDGSLIASQVEGLSYSDKSISKGSATYVYQVCETGTDTCTNESTVIFQ